MRWMILPFLICTACGSVGGQAEGPLSYDGIEAETLDDSLIIIRAAVSGATTPEDAIDYARCAAAQFSLFRGASFARLIRTTVEEVDGQLVADAVYTISEDVPLGARKIDAEVTMASCREAGIPTV